MPELFHPDRETTVKVFSEEVSVESWSLGGQRSWVTWWGEVQCSAFRWASMQEDKWRSKITLWPTNHVQGKLGQNSGFRRLTCWPPRRTREVKIRWPSPSGSVHRPFEGSLRKIWARSRVWRHSDPRSNQKSKVPVSGHPEKPPNMPPIWSPGWGLTIKPKKDIPLKASDVNLLDFSGFDTLKRRIFRRPALSVSPLFGKYFHGGLSVRVE